MLVKLLEKRLLNSGRFVTVAPPAPPYSWKFPVKVILELCLSIVIVSC